jgi:hypothetical protein
VTAGRLALVAFSFASDAACHADGLLRRSACWGSPEVIGARPGVRKRKWLSNRFSKGSALPLSSHVPADAVRIKAPVS